MSQPPPVHKAAHSDAQDVTKEDYLILAGFLEGRDRVQRVHKKEPQGETLRKAGQLYENRKYVGAYDSFKPVYDKVVADMQRVLARNLDFEANQLAREQRISLAAAKSSIQKKKSHAQQVLDQFDRLLTDLKNKPLVRAHLEKGNSSKAGAPHVEEAANATSPASKEVLPDANAVASTEIEWGDQRYQKARYSSPEIGSLYCVRDKSRGECIIKVLGMSSDGTAIDAEVLDSESSASRPVQLSVASLAHQAAKGWCSLLVPIIEIAEASAAVDQPSAAKPTPSAMMRLDIQNFGRCCADIARANIRFDTQLIKDVGDGPFRAGRFDQAFLTFEQYAVGFNSAVASSRRAIADGRRALNAEKGKLSGKEIQERTAAFVRSEQLIHTAEREFSTILEGLRMYLRTQQG